MPAITDLAAAGSVAAGDQLAINQSGTDRRVTADKFAILGVAQNGKLVLGPGTTLTISAGAITATGSFHFVDTQGGAAADDLDTINGGVTGQILLLRSVSGARDVTLKNGTGNLQLGADVTLGTAADMVFLMWVGAYWARVAFADN
jgi:hypothetical protein